nr:hypothetical protein [Tanacetum cinerariifolium]
MKDNINWNEVVKQVQSRQSDVVRKYQVLKVKVVSVAQARKNMMIYLKNMTGFKMDFFKGMSYKEIRPLFEEEYNKVQTLFKKGLEMDAEKIKAPRKKKVKKDQPAKKQKGNELEQDNAKKKKLEEQEEAKELKKNLEIVPDDEDDLIMEAPPLPDYIPGPEAPPSPDYIPGPEYLPPADDVLPAEEQPMPAADGDDEKSEENSIEYLTSRGDDDADDDGDDLSEDDADEEESSDSEEEEEEHKALTIPAPDLHCSIPAYEDSDETEPFEEGETVATPPPFGYRVATRIYVQPHILMPFRSESKVERLLAIPTPPLFPVLPTSYPLPPVLMPLPIFTPLPPPPPIILPRTRASMVLMRSAAPSTFILAPRSRTPPIGTPPLLPIPLPTSSFPLPLLIPSTSGSEGTPEADMPLQKRSHFTTSTDGYEVGESSVSAAARQIRPALTVADIRRAEDRLIGKLRRESTLVTQIEALQKDVSTLQGQHIDDEDRLTRHIQHEHAQRDAAPEDGDSCA